MPRRMNLNFAKTKRIDPRITFTRASSATYFDAFGQLKTAPANTARFDHDPITGECKGLLVEEARTNLLLNSALLVTQSITTTAAARTLSFYGTGTVVLSGTHSATVVGTGDFPTRTTYTYTPSAGTLTLTVTGIVGYANDELGSFASSWIPTLGSTATRAADVASMTGANFSSWYRQDEGTFVVESDTLAVTATDKRTFAVTDGSASNAMSQHYATTSGGVYASAITNGGVYQYGPSEGPYLANTLDKRAFSYKDGSPISVTNGVLGSLASSATADCPTGLNRLDIGSRLNTQYLNGHVARLAYFPYRLSNTELKALSA